MSDVAKYFFILSFTAAGNPGVAIVIACDEKSAKSCLKKQGVYNATPEAYFVSEIKNVGKYCDCAYGLMAESFASSD